ncbi:MAG: twin-arginine translocase TatA/TatE family subunit [Actinomyces sp.]|uniref:twin-arginine translocase TatA/TatE family subunit n=1 Tax=Actinomyces sp. TaxID=29317 RepID=UPI0026DD8CAA|nr:twin-arginine translocase TatA/TatE family subunit [Actinomyces sp.]MDO4242367.1 twin-arginine translocase TatA/TatE family subunit [Actinomyces sp.]
MFGISGAEFFVIVLVAVMVVGPQRLPEYTRKLTQAVRRLRVFLDDAKVQIAEEVGPELGDLDLSDLDPRNYDPRKIVRDALGEDLDAIRRDLANPFQSVAKAAKESGDAAVAAAAGAKGAKTLSTMIKDKAEETRQANAARRAAAAADKDLAQTEAEGQAVIAEIPEVQQVEPVESDEPGEAAEPAELAEPGESVEEPSEARAAEESSGAGPAEASGEDLAEVPGEAGPDDEEAAGEAPSEAAPRRGVLQATGSEEDLAEDPAPVPSSLTEPGTADPVPARPVSPRDIVQAARLAARTRAEAAEVVVDA